MEAIMKKGRFFDELLCLTKELVSFQSISPSAEEIAMADKVASLIRAIPYFAEHPEDLRFIPLPGDPWGRKNVAALLRGTGGNADTVICHGHFDTVPVDDYGALSGTACSCDELARRFSEMDLPPSMAADLASGEWLFGRGACDMKSGDAILLVLMKYLAGRRDRLAGNVLFLFTCDEESENNGMMAAAPVIEEWCRQDGLRPVLALNNDYVGPLYEGDPSRYVYTGTVGKVLLSFCVIGRETHVGRIYEGISASVLAGRLADAIDSNPDFADSYDGEYSQPPALLKLKDLKVGYNVQTARSAFLYFNALLFEKDVKALLDEVKSLAQKEMERYLADLEAKQRAFCRRSGEAFLPLDASPQVITYEELVRLCKEKGIDAKEKAFTIAKDCLYKGMDKRDIACRIAESLCDALHLKGPLAVLFLGAPYCPANTMRREVPFEKETEETILHLVEEASAFSGEAFSVRHFFPCISDASYFKMDDSDASVAAISKNFPAMDVLYPIPLDAIRMLSVPTVNMGVYGKGCHTWEERLYMPYSFNVLPELILRTILRFTGSNADLAAEEK